MCIVKRTRRKKKKALKNNNKRKEKKRKEKKRKGGTHQSNHELPSPKPHGWVSQNLSSYLTHNFLLEQQVPGLVQDSSKRHDFWMITWGIVAVGGGDCLQFSSELSCRYQKLCFHENMRIVDHLYFALQQNFRAACKQRPWETAGRVNVWQGQYTLLVKQTIHSYFRQYYILAKIDVRNYQKSNSKW